jgi:hypothetical protein
VAGGGPRVAGAFAKVPFLVVADGDGRLDADRVATPSVERAAEMLDLLGRIRGRGAGVGSARPPTTISSGPRMRNSI